MISHMPTALTEQMASCATIQYAMMLTHDLGSRNRPDMSYEDAEWLCKQAALSSQETDNYCETQIRRLIRLRVDPITLQFASKGRA